LPGTGRYPRLSIIQPIIYHGKFRQAWTYSALAIDFIRAASSASQALAIWIIGVALRDEDMMKVRQTWLNLAAVAAVVVGLSLIIHKNLPHDGKSQIVNVSYDLTRELYQALNPLFVTSFEKETGRHLSIIQSHGGSSRQARKVISGELPADMVTLGLVTDIDALRKRGLVAENSADRLPNKSVPHTSTVVFVVRKGNPHSIHDWPDLLAPELEIVTPDPRTSGNGKLAALAAWAAITTRGGTEAEAVAYLRALYGHVPVLDEGAGSRGIASPEGDAIGAVGDGTAGDIPGAEGTDRLSGARASGVKRQGLCGEVGGDHAAVKAARKLLDIDKVIAITAVWGSGPILAVRPLTLEKNVVLTALGSADEVTEGDTRGLEQIPLTFSHTPHAQRNLHIPGY
jgi:hypothetical protein